MVEHTLGSYIREHRLKKKVTLRKFADLVGISPTMLSRIELDEHAARVGEDTLKKIAQHLNVDSDALLAMAGKVSSDLIEILLRRPDLRDLIRKV